MECASRHLGFEGVYFHQETSFRLARRCRPTSMRRTLKIAAPSDRTNNFHQPRRAVTNLSCDDSSHITRLLKRRVASSAERSCSAAWITLRSTSPSTRPRRTSTSPCSSPLKERSNFEGSVFGCINGIILE